ncbi:TetR family transcriptional regulator [Paenibacillus harenae]|uniref:AcrR family transcriptional regulator n=1 Tax=Paenibacillus harenae TaxID=306543 RepID=A0ABT9U565_PAEHA|nr:TetR family transcriptional regulator [Paenibacillus harenae]MDQ0114782.1 AcrR family transcriptional regulator [Paenibacillus harenae]
MARKTKAETNETILKLMDIARRHFTEYGYADTVLEQIVLEANLTRGAVYHHFRSKKELFRSVLESVQREVAQRIEQDASTSEDVWEQLYLGCRAFVMAAIEDSSKRIMLIDGPAILGWNVWREMDETHSMSLLRGQLQLMQEQGYLKDASVDAMTHFLSGALNEASLWLAHAEARPNALEEAMRTLALFLEGIRRQE